MLIPQGCLSVLSHGDTAIELNIQTDVVVIGGGLAGLASCIHLSRGGLNVVCLEARETFAHIVGESLDWSAPQLFAELGLSMERLVEAGAATFKRHIKIESMNGHEEEYLPGPWLANKPWNVELRTLHLDRRRVHSLLQEISREANVDMLHERAVGFDVKDKRIVSVQTSAGRTIEARWVVDASGAAASVLGREFNLPFASYGPRKIALWAHFATDDWVEGTTLYTLNGDRDYMEWIWEIPVSDGVSSVGYVAPGSKAKLLRAGGLSNAAILASRMERFPRLRSILKSQSVKHIASTSFLCRTYSTVCGPNWVIVGEAASQSDPITGNGVTAALRHAQEGSAFICRYHEQGTFPALARFTYNLRVSGMGRYFNCLIENLYYEAAVRSLLGLFVIARLYTVPAWLTNVVYSRTRPRGLFGTLALCGTMFALRGAAWGLHRISRVLSPRGRCHPSHATSGRLTAMRKQREATHALHASRQG